VTRKLEIDRDDEGEFRGFAVGKEAALRDWAFRKQQKADEKLFQQLYDKKRNKDPRRKADGLKRAAKHREAHPEETKARWDHLRKNYSADPTKILARRRAATRGKVLTCPCGTSWCPVPGSGQKNFNRRYCSQLCKSRAGKARKPNKTYRDAQIAKGLCPRCTQPKGATTLECPKHSALSAARPSRKRTSAPSTSAGSRQLGSLAEPDVRSGACVSRDAAERPRRGSTKAKAGHGVRTAVPSGA
jgi:hypothetical protein